MRFSIIPGLFDKRYEHFVMEQQEMLVGAPTLFCSPCSEDLAGAHLSLSTSVITPAVAHAKLNNYRMFHCFHLNNLHLGLINPSLWEDWKYIRFP